MLMIGWLSLYDDDWLVYFAWWWLAGLFYMLMIGWISLYDDHDWLVYFVWWWLAGLFCTLMMIGWFILYIDDWLVYFICWWWLAGFISYVDNDWLVYFVHWCWLAGLFHTFMTTVWLRCLAYMRTQTYLKSSRRQISCLMEFYSLYLDRWNKRTAHLMRVI